MKELRPAYVLRFELFDGNRSQRKTVPPREIIALCTWTHMAVNVVAGYKRSICNSVEGDRKVSESLFNFQHKQ